MKKTMSMTLCWVLALTLIVICQSRSSATGQQERVQSLDASAVELVGSTWHISYDNPAFGHREYDLVFRDKGKLVNTHRNETTPDNDTWAIKGRQVVLNFNRGFAIYTGDFLDRDHVTGTAKSRTGGEWKWKAHRLGKEQSDDKSFKG